MNKTLPALPGKAPALPPGAFEIGYTAHDGALHRVPLAEAAGVRFADTQPTRRIRTRKGQRHLPGRWWSATDGRPIGYESWLERGQLMWLDWDRAVTGTASQPFRLRWATEEGEPRSHVPDFFAERGVGPPVVVDCRPAGRRGSRDLAAFQATRRLCGLAGREYRLTGALDPVATANLRWLAGYRYPRYGLPALAGRCGRVRRPVPLVDGAEAAGDPVAVLPVLYHLLWRQELAADLSAGSGVGPGRASIASAGRPPLAGARGDLVRLLPGPGTWARCAAATGHWSRASGPLDCISRCRRGPPLDGEQPRIGSG